MELVDWTQDDIDRVADLLLAAGADMTVAVNPARLAEHILRALAEAGRLRPTKQLNEPRARPSGGVMEPVEFPQWRRDSDGNFVDPPPPPYHCETCGGLLAWVPVMSGHAWRHEVDPDDDHAVVVPWASAYRQDREA